MAEINRVFVTGAPGSTWSGVARKLRQILSTVDNRDITQERWETYGPADEMPNHVGAYFNPGNEFGDWIVNFAHYSRREIETKLDSAFLPQMDPRIADRISPEYIKTLDSRRPVRLHLSHYFAYHLDQIQDQFPDAAILLVEHLPHKCFVWWEYWGGHATTYDAYHYYRGDYDRIWQEIIQQSLLIDQFRSKNHLTPEAFNLSWVREHFLPVTDVDPAEEYLVESDGNLHLQLTPNGYRGLLNTVRVSMLSPWR